ncbi:MULTISPECIES: 3-oxoacyl-[acyl-carrier-protein] reductase [Pseudobutyrivibrio]|uniref:3-oxoacyl-[acyl-carrier-protein] reductase n=1 Tax=Pseudobutyrivibrio ruminis TaxID=46206 RepID=A0A1H7HMB5_9FIRM|nr:MULTISPECIES: 3-oxoacyl-[acyl-carrier-protein] reductase [Pseudobutyrivibrio]SEK51553.1 3-oxoacyl-[acyl-carrier-protein] reductase [Pseudobutyrivibrio ruminis]SET21195.1 3-oxoacyl-[acyl-carrier-protein] reductase [Pseudobutyrivibrio sp. C4]
MSVALVTGGSRGIGRVIAENLAKSGINIAICYSGNENAAQETIESCKKHGVQAMYIKADVSNADDVSEMFNQIKELMGPVEILVNNAGITRDGLLLRMSEADYDAVLDTNLKGTFLCTKAAIKDMMKARNGRIINITSIVGVQGNAGQANYSASKAGVIGFTKSVAREYGSKGITVNAVAPGFIQTAMTDQLPDNVKEAYLKQIPLARFGTPEDVADVVDFLASDKASYITGQVIEVTGGM